MAHVKPPDWSKLSASKPATFAALVKSTVPKAAAAKPAVAKPSKPVAAASAAKPAVAKPPTPAAATPLVASDKTLDPASKQRIENLLKQNGGSVPYAELMVVVPGVTLVKLKAAFPVVFKGGEWVIQQEAAFEASFDDGLKSEITLDLDSFGGYRSVYKIAKKFGIDRAKVRSLGFEMKKDMVLSPAFAEESLSKEEFSNPLEEDKLNRIIELLSNNNGILSYGEVCIAEGNVTKAQLGFHFEVFQHPDGSCEVRIPGVKGTLEELRSDTQPELVPPIPADILEAITLLLESKGGSMDTEDLRDHYPKIKKAQLRDWFDVELTRKVKETGKRFYSVTIKGKKSHKRAQVAVARETNQKTEEFLWLQDVQKGKSKGKGKPFADEASGKSKGKGSKDGKSYGGAPPPKKPRFDQGDWEFDAAYQAIYQAGQQAGWQSGKGAGKGSWKGGKDWWPDFGSFW